MQNPTFIVILVSAIVGTSIAFPATKHFYDNAEELAGKFEGDMDLTPEQLMGMRLRNGLIKETSRWKNRTVDYVISGKFCNY